ncbi:pilin [Thiolapillus sp.]
MKKQQSGFTLIELMIVVAIVGILAAIAIPAYRDYMTRSKVSECAASLGACKTSVAEFSASRGHMPANATSAGCSTTASQYCDTLTVAGGAITIQVSGTGDATADACSLTLTPVVAGGSITAWTGSSAPATCSKYVPAKFR